MFRIGSVTKTFTAIAVMQLCEEGLVDLDAPANDYQRSLRMAIASRIAAASLGGSRLGPAGFHGPGNGSRSLDSPTHRT